jgi:hypothetical protein
MVECPNLTEGNKCRIGDYRVVDARSTCPNCGWREHWLDIDRCEYLDGEVTFSTLKYGDFKPRERVIQATRSLFCKKEDKHIQASYCRSACQERG